MLIPDPPDGARGQAGSSLRDDGSFTLNSFSGSLGVRPGHYRVLLRFPRGKGGANPLSTSYATYTRFESTPLTVDVPEEGLDDLVITLEEQ
jgi:hypothetical protein